MTAATGEWQAGVHNARTFTDRFFEMEAASSLFHLQDREGLLFWDIVRHDVYYSLWARSGGGSVAGAVQRRGGLLEWARDAIRHLHVLGAERRLRRASPRYLIVTASRSRIGSEWTDAIADPCVQRYRDHSFVLESFSKQSKYLRRADGAFASIPRRAWPVDGQALAAPVAGAIREYFQTEIPANELIDIIVEGIRSYRDQLWYFERLLKVSRPAAIVIVSNGVLKGFFHAARRNGVPAFEMQHGLISRLHPYYSYPAGLDYSFLPFLPKALLTFSEFWGGQINFGGIPKLVIGTQHYHARMQAQRREGPRGLLVITAARYHSQLREIVKDLARRHPELPILYKLHPQQYSHMQQIRGEFDGYGNIKACGGERSVAELFALTDVLLTIQSTVVYEALQARLHVILLKHDDYHVHEDVFGMVHLCDDARAVADALDAIEKGGAVRPAAQSFFDPFDSARLDLLLDWQPA